jgi:PST family polysaccharide transporter
MAGLREKTLKGVIWSAFQNVVSPLVSFIIFFILARLLEPAAFGLLALASLTIGFVQLFLNGGFAVAIVQRKSLEPQHLDTAFWVINSIAVLLITVIISTAGLISEFFKEPDLELIIQWLSIMLLFEALSQVQVAQLRRNMAFRSLAIRSLIAEPIGGGIGVWMALSGFGVWSLVARILVTSLCRLFVLWIASDWRPGFQVSRRHFNDMFYFGASMVGTNFVNFLGRRSDTFLIGYFLGTTSLGYYNVGNRLLAMMVEMIGGTLNNVAWPLFSRLQNDLPRLREAFYTATRLVSLLAWPIFLGIIAIAPVMVPVVFGEKWIPSIPVLQIFSFIGLLNSIFLFNGSVIVGVGKPQWRMFLQIAIAVINVLAFFLVVRWGIVAISAVYVIVLYMFAPVSLWIVNRLIGIKMGTYWRQHIVPMFASSVMVIIIMVIQTWFGNVWNEAIFLGFLIISGGLTYVLIVYLVCPSTFSEVTALIKSVRRKGKQDNAGKRTT